MCRKLFQSRSYTTCIYVCGLPLFPPTVFPEKRRLKVCDFGTRTKHIGMHE